MNTVCPKCGRPARRDPDTLDTFVCSSWYFLRYADNKNSDKPFDTERINQMLPVDKYIGGAEHACMHLLYARFITKALRDLGYINFDEPFTSLVHQGIILGPDGYKMSKSRGNVVSPDEFVSKYGADVFRMYLMFGFSYVEGGPWSDEGIKAIAKYFERVERIVDIALTKTNGKRDIGASEKELNYIRHSTIKKVTADVEIFSFNTAIARIMELTNAIMKYDGESDELYRDTVQDLIDLMAPFAPHFTEELNERLGGSYPILYHSYPVAEEKWLTRDEVELAVQLNSKMKTKIKVSSSMDKSELEKYALTVPEIQALLEGLTVRKVIVIPGRLINIVAG